MRHLFVLLLVVLPLSAATYNSPTCNESDVTATIAMAANGDTVTIPACAQTNWSTMLTVTKGITLQGAGQGMTIIGDNVPKGDSTCSAATNPLMTWNITSPNSMRMTALTIVGVATDPYVCSKGHVKVIGSTHSMRIDHITINPAITSSIFIGGDVWGLIDHFTFSGNFVTGVRVEHYGWNGFSSWTDLWGDASWSAPIHYGTGEGLYIEDSSFTGTSNVASAAATDCYSGGRFVFRHNTVSTLDIGSHGTDSDQRHRSCRWMEIYNNTFTYTTINQLGFIAWIRGGTGLFFNNTVTATGYSGTMVQVANCRDPGTGCAGNTTGNFPPWGACDGTSSYDQNTTGQTGWICVDQPGAGTSAQLGPDTAGGITPANTWVGNISDPIYVWNNTLNGSAYNNTAGTTHVQNNRDYFVGTARPGYTAYTYPHPLQGVAGSPTETTSCPLSTGTVGVNYATLGSGVLNATGGTPPYSWSISSGNLPGGLAISGNSIIGTPTTAGSYSFTLLVTDNAAMTGSQACSMTVNTALPQAPVSAAGNRANSGAFVP